MDTIYGWSWKSSSDQYMVAFDSEKEARAWLHKEEYDFRERELLSQERAMEIMGAGVFNEWDERQPCYFETPMSD